jgi:Heterokaryon incompatibility protein (HET)
MYLRDLARKAAGTPYFWVDSLCIPRNRDLRSLAISKMSESYRQSYATIVLDDGIKPLSNLDSSETQILAVSLSTWQERLWTLSESVLSARVLFAFDDELKSSKDLLDLDYAHGHTPLIKMGCTLLDNLSYGMHVGDVTIGALQRNLCRRTSSWLDDENLAVAPLMRIDLAPLLELTGDERMMRFWKLARHVPRSIILESSPKFQVPFIATTWWTYFFWWQKPVNILLATVDGEASVRDRCAYV